MKHLRLSSLLLITFFVLLSFGQFEKITIYSSLSIYVHEVIMGICLIYWGVQSKNLPSILIQKIKRTDPYIKFFCAWVLVGWLVSIWHQSNLLNPIFYTIRILFYVAFIVTLFEQVLRKKIDIHLLKIGLLTASAYILYFGLLQYLFLPDTRFLLFLGWDDHYFRLISTILDPGFTGILFILSIFLLAQVWTKYQLKKIKVSREFSKAIFALLMIGFTLGISLTYSRATYVAYGVSGLITAVALFRTKRNISLLILGSVVLLAISIPLLPRPDGEGVKLERTSTITARSTSAQTALQKLSPIEWITGQGLFETDQNQLISDQPGHNRVPDNWMVMLLSGTGVIGTILFLIALIKTAATHWKKNIWLWGGVSAVLIHGLFNASLVYPFVLIWLGILAINLKNATEQSER